MEYLPLLRNNLKWGNKECKGVPVADIEALEAEIGKTFPKAYREFLELAGEYFPYLYAGDSRFEISGKIQDWLQQQLTKYKQSLEKEYWAIEAYDGVQFYLFYWDEGEDPPVYYCCPYLIDYPEGVVIEKRYDTFADWVNKNIELTRDTIVT